MFLSPLPSTHPKPQYKTLAARRHHQDEKHQRGDAARVAREYRREAEGYNARI